MNVLETIKNIRAVCDNYIDPDLLATVIDDDFYMGSNNIMELKKYGIKSEDAYEERILKILKHENVFISFGMMAFAPGFSECDIYSYEDFTIKLNDKEYEKYSDLKEEQFGILIKKDSDDYLIGTCDLCGCKIDSSFKAFEKSSDSLYKKLEKMIDEKIIS